jgi:hypothetical protein
MARGSSASTDASNERALQSWLHRAINNLRLPPLLQVKRSAMISAMAIIKSLVLGTRDLRVHPSETECEYQQVEGPDGEKYLQLSSFGSAGRKSSGVTQTLQINHEAAEQLITAIRSVFPKA